MHARWIDTTQIVWKRAQVDNVLGRSAELAYFFLFSIFPLLIVLTTLVGLLSTGAEIRAYLWDYFRTALPASAYDLVAHEMQALTDASGGGKLSFGIVVTIASASSGMAALMEGFNAAYRVMEERSWLYQRLLAIVLTIALALLTICALALFLYGDRLGTWVANAAGLERPFQIGWQILQWPVLILLVLLSLALLYKYAPDVHGQRWRSVFPGAAAAVVIWIAASAMLRVYLRVFNSYSTVYGSLGAVMILMLWLYLFGIAILLGAEVNAVLRQEAGKGSSMVQEQLPETAR